MLFPVDVNVVYQVSEMAGLNHLMTELTLGDCRASQLLREMKQLNGDEIGFKLQFFKLQGLTETNLLSSRVWIQSLWTRDKMKCFVLFHQKTKLAGDSVATRNTAPHFPNKL